MTKPIFTDLLDDIKDPQLWVGVLLLAALAAVVIFGFGALETFTAGGL